MSEPVHYDPIGDLRSRIARLDGGGRLGRAAIPTGVPAVDSHLGGGLARGALHEVVGGGDDLAHGAAATLFVASLLGRQRGSVLWILRARDLFAPGLAAAGLHPDRVIYAETGEEAAILAVAEDALRQRGLAGVVAEPARLSLVASRRLLLAAEASGVPAFVIRRLTARAEPDLTGTVATTRWRLTALASASLGSVPGLGNPRWQVDLLRFRGGEPARWILEACDETGRLRLAADLADRPAEAPRRWAAGR